MRILPIFGQIDSVGAQSPADPLQSLIRRLPKPRRRPLDFGKKRMALFGWLSPKTASKAQAAPLATGPVRDGEAKLSDPEERTVPNATQDVARRTENAALREQLRMASMARREHLYTVVRDSLLQEGIMATSYKFKVLALDQGGRQYLVMLDLSPSLGKTSAQLTSIEGVIAKSAKARYEIVVLGTYWRINEQLREADAPVAAAPAPSAVVTPAPIAVAPVTAMSRPAPANATAPAASPPAAAPAEAAASTGANPRYEPLQSEEMLAFKRALAATGAAPAANAPRPAPRSYSPLATGYEDTQVVSPDTRPPGLGPTQFGGM